MVSGPATSRCWVTPPRWWNMRSSSGWRMPWAGAAAEAGGVFTLSSADRGDLGLLASPFGELQLQTQARAWAIELDVSAGVEGVAYGRHGVTLLASPSAAGIEGKISATLAAPKDGPAFILVLHRRGRRVGNRRCGDQSHHGGLRSRADVGDFRKRFEVRHRYRARRRRRLHRQHSAFRRHAGGIRFSAWDGRTQAASLCAEERVLPPPCRSTAHSRASRCPASM